jgi:hypothetical protein
MKFRLAVILALMAWPLEPGSAEAGKTKERPVAPELAKYRATGEVQHCVNRSRIRRTQVLNDYTILFHMRGRKKIFKNELPYRCFGLGFNQSFSYSLSTNLLCNVDIITVFNSGGISGPSCGLGNFEELEKIPKNAGDGDATPDSDAD